jgi:hypothetical protein
MLALKLFKASAAPEGRKEEKYKWRNKKYEE